MQITSTSTFRESLKDLCKKPKHAYTSCRADICEELKDKLIENLVTPNNGVLLDNGVKCVLKIRVSCATRKTGKSGGFRVIAAGNRHTQELTLLEIYPKVGPLGISSIDEDKVNDLLKQYIDERDRGSLVTLDAENKLAEL